MQMWKAVSPAATSCARAPVAATAETRTMTLRLKFFMGCSLAGIEGGLGSFCHGGLARNKPRNLDRFQNRPLVSLERLAGQTAVEDLPKQVAPCFPRRDTQQEPERQPWPS